MSADETLSLEERLALADETLQAVQRAEVEAAPDGPYRLFVDQMQEGALTIDAAGRIRYANPYFARLADLSPEALSGLTLPDLMAPARREAWQDLPEPGMARRWRTELHTRRGPPVPVQVALTALPGTSEATWSVVVTDLRETAQARREERRAPEPDTSRDRLVSVLGHELRAPLNAILGWAEVLAESDRLEGEERRAVEAILRNVRVQTRLVDDLLDLSRIGRGRLRLDLAMADVVPLADEALAAVAAAAASRGVTVTREVEAGPLATLCDPARFRQMLGALLENAVRRSDRGAVTVRLRRSGAEIVVEVTDRGRPLPAESLAHVFELVDSGTPRPALGLGLALVKELANLHGARVSVESAAEATTFTIALPATTPSPRTAGKGALPDLAGVRVLFVDDDEDDSFLACRLLQRAGCEVTTARNSAEALVRLETVRPDILISDLMMPMMDGLTLVNEVRARGYGERALPAIAVTGLSGAQDRELAREAGFQDHVGKPIDARLAWAIASILAEANS